MIGLHRGAMSISAGHHFLDDGVIGDIVAMMLKLQARIKRRARRQRLPALIIIWQAGFQLNQRLIDNIIKIDDWWRLAGNNVAGAQSDKKMACRAMLLGSARSFTA